MLKKIILSVLIIFSGSYFGFSQTQMPVFFADNMVLQQQDNVPIWGTDTPGTTIEIQTTWGVKESVKTNSQGEWKIKVPTQSASFKPQEVKVKGSKTIILHNVLIGEVWFCSGQSNMEIPLGGYKNQPINQGEALINSSKNNNIRLFNTERGSSLTLKNDVAGSWETANPESVRTFSAIAYLFGTQLFEKLQIPVGIIESSWGGTPVECWLPKQKIQNYSDIKIPDTLSQNQDQQKRPTCLYNAMIYPFKNYAVKGFLWYQGEANRRNADRYKGFMHDLVQSWRGQWGNDKLPFYFVQIAPYDYSKYKNSPIINANKVREAQSMAAQEIPHSGVVITADVGNCSRIHPPEKLVVAKRLANWALAKQYNFKEVAYRSPEFRSMNVKGNKAILSFAFFGENKSNRLLDSHRNLQNFEISGADQIFYPAQAKVNKDQTITVYSDEVKDPKALRYGFVDCLKGSLFSEAGLPVSAFRTDHWDE